MFFVNLVTDRELFILHSQSIVMIITITMIIMITIYIKNFT